MDPREVVNPDPRRRLPSVAQLSAEVVALHPELEHWAATAAAREVIEEARSRLSASRPGAPEGEPSAPPAKTDWIQAAATVASRLTRPAPRGVLNATGIVLHTNLGRAPIAPGAARAAFEIASGYTDLEIDLVSGRRGNRMRAVVEKLRQLSGAAGATACNNNAAAVLLALDTLARGREVIVSRGELVEIGGSFRVPDIIARAGVRLIEVGTTNRTHPDDYERAIGRETALLLKVHRSNFEQRGFVSEVDLPQLSEIGRAHDLPVVEDLGSGTLLDLSSRGLPAEVYAPGRLRLGADLVCFSGDKLLGGPQAGIALGRAELVEAMVRNPLARALRLDKVTLAALDWTLRAMLDGRAEEELPVLRRLLEPVEAIELRAHDLAKRLRALQEDGQGDLEIDLASNRAPVGGGSLPGFELDTWVVSIRSRSGGRRPAGGGGADQLAAALRRSSPPLLGRVHDGALLLDLRTLEDQDLPSVVESFRAALLQPKSPD